MKWILRVLLSAAFLSCPHLYKSFTQGFRIPPNRADIPFNPEWEIDADAENEVRAILKQPFAYLDHGNQSYAFVSQDQKYVLKLFRYNRHRFVPTQIAKGWLRKQLGKKNKDKLLIKIDKTFKAARLAYTEGQEFTQVLFCHLNLTQNQFPLVQFRDPWGRNFSLPIDRYRFVIQRKVTPFKEALLAAKEHPEEMHHLIDSFLILIQERSAKGIHNADPNLGPNFGFLDGKAVEIDFGNYRKIAYDPKSSRQEIDNLTTRLNHWLQINAPEYIPHLQAQRAESEN